MNKIWTIGELLQWTQHFFEKKEIDSPRLDAEILLAHVLKKERIYLYAHYDEPMTAGELDLYRDFVKKRADRISVAHLLGTTSFMGMNFIVNSDVLIPRPETEILVETVLSYEKNPAVHIEILDIGTGSGAIILSLLSYLTKASGTGVDISSAALTVAKKNSEAFKLSERVEWLESDLFANVSHRSYTWIVSNPPYLTQEDMQSLQPEVRRDPQQALFGGIDGLSYYRRLAGASWQYMTQDGYCAVEIGAGQCKDVSDIFEAAGHYMIDKIVKDYGDIERIIIFKRKE
ncbi:peptide chain release factor N(5)-glutamine methyltransferase [Megasphaera paucivorans]|uniref:Release factor glutamine methyltransferase n=1 Tax=Megasphaera paucivorans TaxID=349095 RepID=A0A1G9T5W0_9FIRM|nr:peptide chain release factor N(5)-glutamine methyltransferase [Megasphaera paucivorans]SDM43109.1 release factor glutamine methyltransferase [Megasphaera paucivorans]